MRKRYLYTYIIYKYIIKNTKKVYNNYILYFKNKYYKMSEEKMKVMENIQDKSKLKYRNSLDIGINSFSFQDNILSPQNIKKEKMDVMEGFELNTKNFPSKNMEYMTSGTPMIGFKLPGMPSSFFDYIGISNYIM